MVCDIQRLAESERRGEAALATVALATVAKATNAQSGRPIASEARGQWP